MIFVVWRDKITHHMLSQAVFEYPYRSKPVTHDFDEQMT